MARKRIDILYYPENPDLYQTAEKPLHIGSWIFRRHATGITTAHLQRKIYKRTRLIKWRAKILNKTPVRLWGALCPHFFSGGLTSGSGVCYLEQPQRGRK